MESSEERVMHVIHHQASRRGTRRAAFGALAALLLIAAVAQALWHDAGRWQLAAFGVAPDLALFAGAGAGLAKGQLHPRAVRLYNALHSYWAPALLAALALALPAGYLVGALAWAFHISLDRTVGYGLRTRDGFQRS
jgi:uncharacterized protein DUF4260